MIICLEGIDGSGKSSQAGTLTQRLNAALFKFPDRRTPTGKLIYEHLEGKWRTLRGEVPPAVPDAAREALVFQALQLANRMEVATDIMRAAAKGDVVFDRYWPSGYAYGKADGLDADYLVNLHRWLPQPDLFILVDIDSKQSVERRPERRDRYEKAQGGYMEQVTANYRDLWFGTHYTGVWSLVDGRGSKESTAAQIFDAVAATRERLTR